MRCKIQCLLMGLLVSGFLIYPAFAESSFPDVDENSEYAEAIEAQYETQYRYQDWIPG